VGFNVVLFGAGASRDQAANGQPPLTDGLYAQLADIYPSWKAERASFEGKPFEAAMAAVLRADEQIKSETREYDPERKYFKQTFPAPKLRSTELQWDLAEFFFGFDLGPDSLYERFCLRAAGAIRTGAVRLATLNYDALLFGALAKAGIAYNVGQVGAAVESAWVCLPHGSSMLGCQAGVMTDGGMSAGGKGLSAEFTFGSLGIISSGTVRLFAEMDELRAKRARQQGTPTLCFIEPSKTVTSCVNVIESHQLLWRKWMADASRLVVIGARLAEVDNHIWGAVAAAVRRGMEVCYVSGRAAKEFGEWCARNGRSPASPPQNWHWKDAFEETCQFLGV
jgi:hypothetical protein